jgi:hypothetical protein
MSLQFGCDPEVFATVNNLAISPAMMEKFCNLEIVEIDLAEKHPVYIKKDDFSWMQDGVAWELTVRHPVKTAKEMYTILNNSLQCLEEYFSKLNYKGEKLNLFKQPVVSINPMEYYPYLEENKIHQGFIFGCDPDRDAIVPEYRCNEIDVLTHLFRYGGGHIHISGAEELSKYILPAVKLLAITVGNFCVANSPYPEAEKQRATTYGRPGRYRPQHYPNGDTGVEYRSPSNSWISFPEDKIDELFSWIHKAVYYLQNNTIGTKVIRENLDNTISAITNADQNLSKTILGNLQ